MRHDPPPLGGHVSQRASVEDGFKHHMLVPNAGQIHITRHRRQVLAVPAYVIYLSMPSLKPPLLIALSIRTF